MEVSQTVFISEERNQSFTRIAISVFCFVGVSAIILIKGGAGSFSPTLGLKVIAAHTAFSLAWHIWMRRQPQYWRRRIPVAMVADLSATSLALGLTGSYGSFFYPIILYVVVGYGLRYGRKYLVLAALTGFTSFGLILGYSEYWSQNRDIGLGLMMGVLVLPSFFLTVLKRLEALNVKLGNELIRSHEAEKAKGVFLANMSHEIRTPLNGVIGMTEILMSAPLEEDVHSQVEIINRSGEALLCVINDVLDYSKINSGQLTLEETPFDLRQLLEDLVAMLEVGARKKGMALTLEYDSKLSRFFSGDPTRVRQILTNLVGNGIKFTSEGAVRVIARVPESTESEFTVLLQVVDSGVGIPQDRLKAIFQPFEQADRSTSRKFGGSGLGLSISRQLVDLMCGELSADSTEGNGSVFNLKLALPPCKAPPGVHSGSENRPNFGFHALLVEDHRVNQIVGEKLLGRLGISVDIADNGAIALEKLETGNYDLIFMDLHMPVMNGWDATAAIRSRQDELANIPIVALTADADLGSQIKALEAGMNAHLAKPMRLGDIVSVLESLPVLVPIPE